MILKEKALKLKNDIPALIFALKSEKTPWYAKAVAAVTVAYALSPIDFIPDFIPVLGVVDDLIVLPLLVALFIKLVPDCVMDECRQKAQGDARKRWYFALPIIALWGIIILLIAKIIINCW